MTKTNGEEDAVGNVVITGANRGIGLALTRQYAEAGDNVLALCRSPEKAEALQKLAAQSGGRVKVGAIDIGDTASVEAAAKLVDGPVDILINNAGVLGGDPERQTLQNIDYDAWADSFNIMAMGPFRVVKAFLPALEKAKGAKIMSVSSQLAASTWPYGGYYVYSSAKAAGNRIMQILAIDLKDKGIAVANIHPGYVQTDMGGPNAEITPDESAAGIRNVIANLTLENSGKFFKWNGEFHPL